MSESQPLIPNLHEMMEEYAGAETESAFAPPEEMRQQETMEKEKVVENPLEAGEERADESRKRKRRAEEDDVEDISEPPTKESAFI